MSKKFPRNEARLACQRNPQINRKCMHGMALIPMHDVISMTENCAVLKGRMCDRHNEAVYCLNTFLREMTTIEAALHVWLQIFRNCCQMMIGRRLYRSLIFH